jgi:peptide/nickel transport system substrate-binding protein
MPIRRAPLASTILAAPMLLCAAATAAPFQCPKTGGTFTFAQSANVNGLDQMTSSAVSTRNIAMNIFETLVTRSDTNQPIPELASSITPSADQLSYTFKLRDGITFHNGKKMSAADVLASYERYKRVGLQRNTFDNIASWEITDPATFVMHLKEVQPTFLEQLSSFAVPIVIVPAELEADLPQQLRTIGTGPWSLVEFTPGSAVRLKRFDGYAANAAYDDRTGFGGYKKACFDAVTFRIVTEPGARVAGLQTGEIQGAEDVPTKAVEALKSDRNIVLVPIQNWSILIAYANLQQPPTDRLEVRQAIQAAMNMDDIMDAATDGNYRLNVGFQYPNQGTYSDAGKETYDQRNTAKAKDLLAKAGYKGEKIVLLTNKDYTYMYNASVVMAEQLKAIGLNIEVKITDWPTAVAMRQKPDSGWNYFYTGWGTEPSLGPIPTMQVLVPPNPVYAPRPGQDDPALAAAFRDMSMQPTADARQVAFARMQKRTLEQAYVVPFGSITQVQGFRANVKGFKPFRIPRVSNVWFD